ncbi:HpcH/HpaI aldolase/citrate lyase family protein [Aureimonas frigidaquae]|uniref:Citrate (Pro-3S)-lyase n=1 Tax=Aureimonas frigidaquae TaxID=424757 RepID=A0A0P0Z1N8_9HYPH|nr:CoA ester lyase [Aureimonas frigidaquae]BAT27587.1 citrate (pro-3S)-lyase [Aureimonas frigidaquae]
MNATRTLLRSALFVPAANARALAKSAGLAPDAIIFDLEDSAAPGEKAAAREALRAHLSRPRSRALHVVRINPLASADGTEDMLMARGARVDAILLPKVESAAQLVELSDALAETDAPAHLRIWAMLETPKGILNAGRIVEAPLRYRLAALVAGPNDIVAQARLRLSPGRPELLPWLAQIVLAGKAADIVVLDGVYNDFRDTAGFEAECSAGRNMGFDGKTLIHPGQIDGANRHFGPSQAEIDDAREIVAAFDDPAHAGRGVIKLGGRMVERLHLNAATALLAGLGEGQDRKEPQ